MKKLNQTPVFSRFKTNPYIFIDGLKVLKNNVLGPAHVNTVSPIAKQNETLNEIDNKQCSILFLGDFLSIKNLQPVFSEKLLALAESCDYLVVNLEGVFPTTYRWSLFSQENQLRHVNTLKKLMPAEKCFINMANNHSADHGEQSLANTINTLHQQGFKTFGHTSQPSIKIDNNIYIEGATQWSNQKTNYLPVFTDDMQPSQKGFNILYPHWGHELEYEPRSEQEAVADKLLENWDAIIGHHSHTPQTVSYFVKKQQKKLVAYSLGDFACEFKRAIFRQGIVLKTSIGETVKGQTVIGDIEYYSSSCELKDNELFIDIKSR